MTHTVDINLTARDEQARQAWIWRLCRDFDLTVNIVSANVEPEFGTMHIQVEGEVEEIQRATAWLMTTGMHVDALQRSVGA